MTLGNHARILRAVEIRFAPIPRSVAADGPPGRAGEANAGAKHQADSRRREDAYPVFPAIRRMPAAEHHRSDPGGVPETRVRRLKQVQYEARYHPEQRDGIRAPQ